MYGLARPTLTTVVAGKDRLLTLEPMSFSIQANTNVVKSSKYSSTGQIVTAGSAKQSVQTTLTLGVEAINWMTMQIVHGELASTVTNVELPELFYATLPLTGAQEINDVRITANLAKVSAAVYSDDSAFSLSPVATAPAAGQFSVAAGKLTVGPGYAGKVIGYRLLQTVPTCESIGVEPGAVLLNKMRLDGVLQTDSATHITRISIPELSQENEPSIQIAAPTRFDLNFSLITPPGRPRPYELYQVPIA